MFWEVMVKGTIGSLCMINFMSRPQGRFVVCGIELWRTDGWRERRSGRSSGCSVSGGFRVDVAAVCDFGMRIVLIVSGRCVVRGGIAAQGGLRCMRWAQWCNLGYGR